MTYTPHVWSRHDKLDSADLNRLEQTVSDAATNAAALAALVNAPPDTAIATAVNGPGTQTQTALATYGDNRWNRGINVMNPKYGVKADGATLADGAMAAGSAVLTSASVAFAASDVGKTVTVAGAGVSGVPLFATVSSVSGGAATLSVAASTAVTAASVIYGTDDTAAINAALADVSTALGIVDVYFRDGTYMIYGVNTTISSHKDRWQQAGIQPKAGTKMHLTPGAVLKLISNGSPGYSIIYLGQGCDGVTITGGQILGDRATHDYTTDTAYPTHEWGFGIALHGAANVTVEGVKISGCTGDSIFMGSPGMIGLPGLPYTPESEVIIRHCTLDAARRNNISLTATDHVTVENNLITNAGINDGIHAGTGPSVGIDIEGYGEGTTDYEIPYRVTIRNNRFFGNVVASIMDFDGYQAVITGNYCDNMISFGYGTEVVISDNVIVNTSNTTGVGISSNGFGTGSNEYDANSVINGNVVEGFATGILVQRDNVLVTGNFVSKFQNTGIGSSSTANGVTIVGNRIVNGLGSAAIGVSIGGTLATVENNEIRNVRTGVNINNNATGNVVQSNVITQGYQGVFISSGAQVTVRGNTFDLAGHSAGQSYDVYWTSTSMVLCEGNTFRNSATYPISAACASTGGRSRIIGNRFIDTPAPISLAGPGTFHVIDNVFVLNKTSGSNYYPILLAGGVVKPLLAGNKAYHSGTVPYSYLVYVGTTGASGTRVVGNTVVTATGTGTLITGTDTGTPIESGNNVVPA